MIRRFEVGLDDLRSNIFQRGFVSLVVTQFFGAANDNLLKGVLSFGVAAAGFWAAALGDGGQAYVFWCLTIPFILFSGYAGQIADRVSKQRVTVFVKISEIGIACIALVGFWTLNLWLCLIVMILLAIQSAFFGPAKYGMIPELVEDHELSRANGAINMFTNIAIIIGMLIAGPIYEVWESGAILTSNGDDRFTFLTRAPGLALLLIAVLGYAAARMIPKLKARDPNLRFTLNPVSTYWKTLQEMRGQPIMWVALAWSYFYLVGAMAILILPDYPDVLGVSETMVSYLMGLMGVSIGLGSILAGLISGHRIEPRLVPIGAIGMTVFFVLLGALTPSYSVTAVLIFGAGLFAGFYIIPLQALLQYLSPSDERGRFLGTANALSFVFSSVASLIFLLARQTFNLPANRVFLICGVLSIFGTGILIFKMRHVILDPALRRRTSEESDRASSDDPVT